MGGVCGTCWAKVTDGLVVTRRNFALEDDEVDAGFVHTCQSLPDGGRGSGCNLAATGCEGRGGKGRESGTLK